LTRRRVCSANCDVFAQAGFESRGMTPLDTTDDGRSDKDESGPSIEGPQLRLTRDWARLIAVHIYVAGLTPFVAATFYSIVSSDRATLLSGRGFFTYLVLVGCTYVFFGGFAIAAVILASPALALFSKLTVPWVGCILAIGVMSVLAWVIGGVSDVRAFQIAATATAALASAKLERAWRKTRPNR
jgi:hypothetical protein